MYKTPLFLLLFASLAVAQQPLFRVMDINVGAAERILFPDGKAAMVKLLALGESRNQVRSAIWDARAEVEIN